MSSDASLETCPGCGDALGRSGGATHPYVGASAACWSRFAEAGVTLPPAPLRRLVTDAYMVQHPGVPERRSIRSVCVHLVALCLVLEHDLPPDHLSATLQRIVDRPPAWRWLDPPIPNGDATIGEVIAAAERGEATTAIDAYVRGIWRAWAMHHETVEAWTREAWTVRA
jgi:hypothetical protein